MLMKTNLAGQFISIIYLLKLAVKSFATPATHQFWETKDYGRVLGALQN